MPRYCPRCGQSAAGGEDPLCRECGERVQDQGYCGVCGGFWRLPAGADCPKHDIPLEAAPPPAEPPFAPGEPVVWETIARYNHPSAAQAPRIRLEAEGIPTFLDGERMAAHALHHPLRGGVALRVPRSLADEARIVLAQTWSPLPTVDDLDAWDDEPGPEPGATRRTVMRGIIIVILVLPLLRALALWLQS